MGTFIGKLKPFEKKLEGKVRKEGITIAISGLVGSGKSFVAGKIAKELDLELISGGKAFRTLAEKWNTTVEEVSKKRGPEVDLFLDKEVLEKGMKGNIVIESHISCWVLGDWAELRVLVDTPAEIRAKRVADREGMSLHEAVRRVSERDKANWDVYNRLYSLDFRDKSVFNIIIDNSGTLKELDNQVEEIIKIARKISKNK